MARCFIVTANGRAVFDRNSVIHNLSCPTLIREDNQAMRVLALDTSTAACSVAIWDSEHTSGFLIAHRYEAMERGQSEALAPMVHAVLLDAGHAIRDMDFLAVTTGPGAFTGVRIGLAMARALGLSADLPVRGVSTMEAVAHGVWQEDRRAAWTAVVMDTKRDDVYVQIFDPTLAPAGGPEIILPEEIMRVLEGVPGNEAVLVVGDAVGRVGPHISDPARRIRVLHDVLLPDAAVVAAISAAAGPPPPGMPPPSPVYLRPPYAKISPTGGKLRP